VGADEVEGGAGGLVCADGVHGVDAAEPKLLQRAFGDGPELTVSTKKEEFKEPRKEMQKEEANAAPEACRG
jgi:hypothetical protein